MEGVAIFEKPVVIQLGRIDRDRVVVGVRDAATLLLYEWPENSSAREAAMQACLAAIKGEASVTMARDAFVAAAQAARIYLGDLP
ncbi:DUF982 domain-containing protein [Pseudaminobacter sp. 19-2017]|uniref:DUF982 domain-containing protein n=1 Tax=Pseudaminobacter soli (ex Zhang et al. 2022) TaxID=2831468 RepID=A0A942IBM2_9HYPH|nr:DUF982 domain-containing protein [Pseudaminobacter soli]MBS3652445.1 DUF982 domain-containing protein [Pseudaminobacter soli]